MIDPNPDPMRCHVCDIDLDPSEDDPEVHYCSVECAIGNKDDTEEFGIIQFRAQPWDAERGRDSDGCWSWIVTIPGWSPVPTSGSKLWIRLAGERKPRRATVSGNVWWSRFGGRRVYAIPLTDRTMTNRRLHEDHSRLHRASHRQPGSGKWNIYVGESSLSALSEWRRVYRDMGSARWPDAAFSTEDRA